MVLPYLPAVCALAKSDDNPIVSDALWCLAYFCDGGEERLVHMLRTNVLPVVLQRVASNSEQVHAPAMRIVGSVATGPDYLVEALLNMGALHALTQLLSLRPRQNVRKELFFTLSNITAGWLPHVRLFLDSPLAPHTVAAANQEDSEVALQALWTLANATTNFETDTKLLGVLLEQGVVDTLYTNISRQDLKAKMVCLEGFCNCVQAAGQSEKNEVARRAIELDGCNRLLLHEDYQGAIGENATSILEVVRAQFGKLTA
jgi:hypothetical protein